MQVFRVDFATASLFNRFKLSHDLTLFPFGFSLSLIAQCDQTCSLLSDRLDLLVVSVDLGHQGSFLELVKPRESYEVLVARFSLKLGDLPLQ